MKYTPAIITMLPCVLKSGYLKKHLKKNSNKKINNPLKQV